MDCLIGIGTSIAGTVAEHTVNAVGRQIGYFIMYKRNVEDLRAGIEDLKLAKERVDHSVSEARNNCGRIEGDVQHWLSKADSISGEAVKLVPGDGDQANKCFPSPITRYKLSKKAKKSVDVIAAAVEQAKALGKVYYRLPPSNSIKINGYEEFGTRAHVFAEIMEEVKHVRVRTIGVWGMGGVGKTMLVQAIASQAKSDNLFTHVILTTISQTPDSRSIQEEVAEALGLKLDENTVSLRAKRLRERLSTERKILIIIDDIWSRLDLEGIGIFFADDQNQCKILLTSRSQDVLCNEMGADKIFNLGVLSEFEAVDLFDQNAGDLAKEREFRIVKKNILQKCAGLPLAISIVAKALKDKSLPIWEDAWQELRMSNPTNLKGVEKEVYSVIRWSYDFLQSEEAKSLLVLCSLHKEDQEISVEALLRSAMGLRFFHRIRKLKDARNKVFHLVDTLKSSSLLLDGSKDNNVRMHDVIRDVLLSIASKDRQMYFITNTEELNERLNDNELEDSTAICLRFNSGTSDLLQERLLCPKLRLFSLSPYQIETNLQIPNQFFESTKDLQVLDLISVDVNFSSLSNLCFLSNIRTLICSESSLGDIACMGEMICLEILVLSGSDIKVVPNQLRSLTRLLSLDLSDCSELEVIEEGVLSSFVQLEELSMSDCKYCWASLTDVSNNARLTELSELTHIKTLFLDILDADNVLPDDLAVDKLERFQFRVTSSSDESNTFKKQHLLMSRSEIFEVKQSLSVTSSLILKEVNDSLLERSCLKLLIEKAKNLDMTRVNIKTSFSDELWKLRFVKVLTLYNVPTVRYVIDTSGSSNMSAFPMLEELYLTGLENLETICNGCNLSVETMAKLRAVVVRECQSLKNLFPLSFSFRRLEQIEVCDCEDLEDIFINNKDVDDVIEFPLLHSVRLESIPNLKQFAVGSVATRMRDDDRLPLFHHQVAFPKLKKIDLDELDQLEMIWQSDDHECIPGSFGELESVSIARCNALVTLFSHHKVAFPTLAKLHLKSLKRLEMIWPDDDDGASDGSFSNLEELEISSCEKLTRVCSSAMLRRLRSLTALSVVYCYEMEDVIEIRNPIASKEMILIDCPLSYLELSHLPKLKHVVSCYKEECQLLATSVAFPRLKNMDLSFLGQFEMIWQGDQEHISCSFGELEMVELNLCDALIRVFSHDFSGNLGSLIELNIKSCAKMEEVFEMQSAKRSNKNQCNPRLGFSTPKLKKVNVQRCPRLRSLFPPSVAKDLPQLRSVIIEDCGQMQEIIGRDEKEAPELIPKFEFPKLTKLRLNNLPELKYLYPDLHASNWPSLSELTMNKCVKVKILASQLSTFKMSMIHDAGSNYTPLFTMETVTFPMLTQMVLHSLCVSDSKDHLPNLRGFLFGASASFKHLTTLSLLKCGFTGSLLHPSTAKSLSQLNSLSITQCNGMTEVIGDASEEGEIVFGKLEMLMLVFLPKLVSFHSGKYALVFPSLDTLIVLHCSEMKSFSAVAETPKLEFIVTASRNSIPSAYVSGDHIYNMNLLKKPGYTEAHWDGDTNSTLQKFHYLSQDIDAARYGVDEEGETSGGFKQIADVPEAETND